MFQNSQVFEKVINQVTSNNSCQITHTDLSHRAMATSGYRFNRLDRMDEIQREHPRLVGSQSIDSLLREELQEDFCELSGKQKVLRGLQARRGKEDHSSMNTQMMKMDFTYNTSISNAQQEIKRCQDPTRLLVLTRSTIAGCELEVKSIGLVFEQVCQRLQENLANFKGYILKREKVAEEAKNTRNKEITKLVLLQDISEEENFVREIDWSSMTVQEFIGLACFDKKLSAAIQNHIVQSVRMHNKLIILADSAKETLAFDRYGSHVLIKLCHKSQEILESVLEMVSRDFYNLTKDEFGSKLLQSLIKIDPTAAEFIIRRLFSNWKKLTFNTPAIFLLTACLRITQNTDPTFKMLGSSLVECARHQFMPKYQKRVLVSYLEFCEESELDLFYEVFDFKNRLIHHFEDKYMVYIFRLLLKRGHKRTLKRLLTNLDHHKIQQFLDTKYSKFLLAKVLVESRLDGFADEITQKIIRTLEKKTESLDNLDTRSYPPSRNSLPRPSSTSPATPSSKIRDVVRMAPHDVWFLLLLALSSSRLCQDTSSQASEGLRSPVVEYKLIDLCRVITKFTPFSTHSVSSN